jgi:BNR/Asp-box repeat protein
MSGRVTAVVGVPGNPSILFAGHSTAGLFKSDDGGVTFKSIFDDGGTLSIGAVALDPHNPAVIYVGTGEGNPRNSASFGDGVYRSTDGGKTWQHLGLEKTERIARVLVDPHNPQVILVAAMGHEWGANPDRGVFRSSDGGKTWQRVLYVNDTTGASDLVFDPTNPNIVFAGTFDYLRQPWHLRSGGEGSGLWRSHDNGVTWQKLSDPALKNGLPPAPTDRVGVAVAASNPQVVYAFLPSKEGLLWRSDDGGDHWHLVSSNRAIDTRAFYFSRVIVDPANENRLYTLAGELSLSIDGGKTWRPIEAGGDNHDLWIDPTNPRRILLGSDMGFNVSTNHGATWDYFDTLPWGQAYRVGYDLAEPYHVMGGFQDHEVWWGPSTMWRQNGAQNGDWIHICPWGDGQYTMADPRDPNIIYFDNHFGDMSRLDLRTGVTRYITPFPVLESGNGVGGFKYRFSWNAPFLISRHNPDVIYFGGNVLFKTQNGGESWQTISPDLTTNDPEKQKSSGGPVSSDNSNAEAFCTIFAIGEDARDPAVIWAGTDDGNVQITRDGGAYWTNVASNIHGLPAGSPVASLDASPSAPGRAYIAFDRHQLDDFAPYVFVTDDYGKTWRPIAQGLPTYVHIVREDPKQPSLLYAGTELGPYASLDSGQTWLDLRLGLPRLPVYDLVVHPVSNDLIIATHARGFYILDDATPLQHLAEAVNSKLTLFPPMPGTRHGEIAYMPNHGQRGFEAPNRPYGAILSFFLPQALAKDEKVSIEILNSDGKPARTLESEGHAGINRVAWDLREDVSGEPPPQAAEGPRRRRRELGPEMLPGENAVRLKAGTETASTKVTVRGDPNWKFSEQELAEHRKASEQLSQMQEQAQTAARQAENVHAQIVELQKRLKDSKLKEEGETLQKGLEAVTKELGSTDEYPLNSSPPLLAQIGFLLRLVDSFPGAPTEAQAQLMKQRDGELRKSLANAKELLDGKLKEFNAHLRSAGVQVIQAPYPEK